MRRTLKIVVAIYLTMVCTLPAFGKRNSLAGCTFRNYDFHVVELRFYDSNYCECRQWFDLPLPHDNGVRVDTLLYHTKGCQLILENPHVPEDEQRIGDQCIDYLSLNFVPSCSIIRDGRELKEYSIHTARPSSLRPSSRGYWYRWPRQSIGIFELPDFLNLACYEFYQIEGPKNRTHYQDNKPPYPEWKCHFEGFAYPCDEMLIKGTWGFLWFSRERVTANTDRTKTAILGKRFVCTPDSLIFDNDSVYVIHSTSARTCRYQVDGANVLIYGLDMSVPEKADTLVYKDNVLYHACVTQTSNALRPIVQPTGIIDYIPEKYAPTAQMATRAYVLESSDVTDEQIGNTFQRIFTPMNFHSFVPSDEE